MLETSEKYYLDTIRENEVEYWHQQMSNPKNNAEFSNNTIPELKVLNEIYAECRFVNDSKGSHIFIFKNPRAMLGYFTIIENARKNYEIGFRILKSDNRNTGIMSEVLPMAIRHIIRTRNPQTIYARVAQRNQPAERILLRNGFERTGFEVITVNEAETTVLKLALHRVKH